jgi:hypothetical protein
MFPVDSNCLPDLFLIYGMAMYRFEFPLQDLTIAVIFSSKLLIIGIKFPKQRFRQKLGFKTFLSL